VVASGPEAGEGVPPGWVGYDDDGCGAAGGAAAQGVSGLDEGVEAGGVAAAVGVGVADVVAEGAFDVGSAGAEGYGEQGSGLGGVHRVDTVAMAASQPRRRSGRDRRRCCAAG
jgi:hypothetical protein